MNKLMIAIVGALMIAAPTEARELTAQEALQRVVRSNAISTNGKLKALSRGADGAVSLARTLKKNNKPTIYLFKSGTDGFMVLPADDNVETPVLAYGEDGNFDADNLPDALRELLAQYENEVSIAAGIDDDWTQDATDSRAPIDPILGTMWNQTQFFNDYTPRINGQATPTGCVATAMAQCMSVSRWPEQGKGSVSYKQNADGNVYALNLDTLSFDWSKMPDCPYIGCSSAQSAELSKLMYAVGMACRTQYSLSGSSGSLLSAAKALIENFDYGESVVCLDRNYFGFDEWETIIYNELAAGRPVIYSGSSTTEGHAFVCDGYRNGGYFHINWGWGGGSNGYFKLTALTPNKMYRAMAQAGYNSNQSAVIGIAPSYAGLPDAIHLRCSGDFKAQAASYARSATSKASFTCTNGVFSMGHASAKVTLGLHFIDNSGASSHAAGTSQRTFSSMSATQRIEVKTSEFPTVSGNYEVRPAYLDADGEWHDVNVILSRRGKLAMTIAGNSIRFADTELPELTVDELELTSPLFKGEYYGIRARMTNYGDEFFDKVYPVLTTYDGTIIGKSNPIDVDVRPQSEETYSWSGTMVPLQSGTAIVQGDYMLALARRDGSTYVPICDGIEVSYRILSGEGMLVRTSALSVNDISGDASSPETPLNVRTSAAECTLDIECEQGYFGQNVTLRVFKVNGNTTLPVYVTDPEFVGVESGSSMTLTAHIDVSSLKEGEVYKVVPYGARSGQLDDHAAYITPGNGHTTDIELNDYTNGGFCFDSGSNTAIVNSNSKIRKIEVYDLAGMAQPVEVNYDNTHATLGVENLRAGLYIVSLSNVDGRGESHKMLKH